MSFAAPLFLLGALTAAIPIVVHLLKREPDVRVRFSAVQLLRSAPVEHASRRNLRELLLLAVRVAALLLLAFAFARPLLVGATAGATRGGVVVAVDTSSSLSAPGQFEKARDLARRAIDAATGPVAVLTFADGAQVASDWAAGRAAARQAVDAARPSAGGTSYRVALERAGDLLRGRSGRVVVVTDLQAVGWGPGDHVTVPPSVTVEVADVGAPPPDLAILSAREADGRVVAAIGNTGPAAKTAPVELSVATGAPDSRPEIATAVTATLPPGQTTEVSLAARPGRWAVVRVRDESGAVDDNVRYLVLNGTERPRVLVVTSTGDLDREAFYVSRALLASQTAVGSYEIEGVGGPGLQAWDQARIDRHAAVVILSTRGLEHHGRTLLGAFVRAGGGVLAAAGPDVDGEVMAELLGRSGFALTPTSGGTPLTPVPQTLVPEDVRHPVFGAFAGGASIGGARFRQVAAIRAEGCVTLARFTSGAPGMVECEAGRGRALLVGSDLDNRGNDLPLRASFVPFLHEAVAYVAARRQATDFVVGSVPPGVPPVPGVVAIQSAAGAGRHLASVNVDPGESSPARLTVDEFLSPLVRSKPAGNEGEASSPAADSGRPLWRVALAAMLALLVMESGLAARTA